MQLCFFVLPFAWHKAWVGQELNAVSPARTEHLGEGEEPRRPRRKLLFLYRQTEEVGWVGSAVRDVLIVKLRAVIPKE